MRAHLDQVPGDELLVLARGECELAGGVEGEGRHARAVLVQSLLHLPRPHLHNADNNIIIKLQNTRKILIERKILQFMICARITSSLLMTSQTGMGSQLLCLSVPTDPRNAVLGGAIHKRGCCL